MAADSKKGPKTGARPAAPAWGLAAMMVLLLAAADARCQTAAHSCSGYASPGTITITNTFTYSSGKVDQFIWYPQVPADWTVTNVRGDGSPIMDGAGYIGLTAFTFPNPIVFYYDVTIPSGETGDKEITADVWYDLGPGLVQTRATPDPLVLQNLARNLQILSAYGMATPAVGVHPNPLGTVLDVSVTKYSAYIGSTQYVCTGWTMTGNEPSSGTTTNFSMTVTNDAVLTWLWGPYNVLPVANPNVAGTRQGLPVSISAAKLLYNDTDPDGDPLTVTGVSATSSQGGTVSLATGTVTYTPAGAFSGTDTFTYTIADGRGGSATGTVTVTVAAGVTGPVSLNVVYGPQISAGEVVIRFAGVPGYTYTIEYTDRLSPANWQKRANATAPSTPGSFGIGVFEFRDSTSGAPSRFYRTFWPAY
jgi:hypothetical protein